MERSKSISVGSQSKAASTGGKKTQPFSIREEAKQIYLDELWKDAPGFSLT